MNTRISLVLASLVNAALYSRMECGPMSSGGARRWVDLTRLDALERWANAWANRSGPIGRIWPWQTQKKYKDLNSAAA